MLIRNGEVFPLSKKSAISVEGGTLDSDDSGSSICVEATPIPILDGNSRSQQKMTAASLSIGFGHRLSWRNDECASNS